MIAQPNRPVTLQAFERHVAATRRVFDRGRTLGASRASMCARANFYATHYTPTDAGWIDQWGWAERGNAIEKFWCASMRGWFGANFLYGGDEQRTFVFEHLSATPDGLLVNQNRDLLEGHGVPDIGEDRCILVECKSYDPRAHLNEPKIEHVAQVQIQLGVLRGVTRHQPEFGLISYVNASRFDHVREFAVKFDERLFEHLRRRAEKILTAKSASEVEPEGRVRGGMAECQFCAWAGPCRKTEFVTNVTNDPTAHRAVEQ